MIFSTRLASLPFAMTVAASAWAMKSWCRHAIQAFNSAHDPRPTGVTGFARHRDLGDAAYRRA